MKEEIIKKAQERLDEDNIHLNEEDVNIEQDVSVVKIGYKDGQVEIPISQNVINECVKYLIGAAIFAAGALATKMIQNK